MRTLEYNHNNDWRDKLLNSWPFLVDSDEVNTLFAFAYCKESNAFRWMQCDDRSLFNNGTLFVRYTFSPLTNAVWFGATVAMLMLSPWFLLAFLYGLCFHVSWSETGNRRYLQAGFLHKLNGRIGLIFRVPKNDEKSSRGAHENAPNSGQGKNWECGTK
jgi:hypothetical protein